MAVNEECPGDSDEPSRSDGVRINRDDCISPYVFVGLLYVIVEYCRYGNLRSYLLSKRPSFLDTMQTSMETVTKLERSESVNSHSTSITSSGKPEYINTNAR